MTTKCYIPVLGKRLRVTPTDDCGNPPDAGAENAWLATDGFITVTLTAEVEEGSEIITKKANGAFCVNEKQADSFKRFTVEIEFCGVNPSLLSMVTNAEPYEDAAGDIVGFTIGEGAIDKKFALELWTGLSGQTCEPGEEASGYMLLPYVNAGIVGDITIDGENAVTFSMTGAYTKGGNAWGVGPYDVTAEGPLPTALDPYDHFLLMETTLAPPPDACDPQPMPTTAVARNRVAASMANAESGTQAYPLTIVSPLNGATDVSPVVPISGIGQAGVTVTVQYRKGNGQYGDIASTTVAEDGSWTLDEITPMASGEQTIRAVTDSDTSETITFTVAESS